MKIPSDISREDLSTDMQDWFCDGIRLTYAKSSFTKNDMHQGHSNADVVRLHFGLKGDYSVTYNQIGKSFDLAGGHHNLFYSKEFDMEFFNKTRKIETFGIQFPKEKFLQFTDNANDALQRFSEKILKGENVIFSGKWGAIDLPIQQVIRQVLHNPYTNGLQQLFLLSKSIELLVLSTEAILSPQESKSSVIKNNTEKEKIIAARDIINEHLKAPLTLSQLAKMTGLNEYKLKHGFKETFKSTVFNYLNEQRLLLARDYLRDTQKSVAEIAYDMGYSTPQYFNNAFKRKFGRTPKSVRKNP
ncbi:helix-turn-helix domain-containing protein [Niabella ginsenosidivorans]|nr:AraC family transcriptional regulator [Niabella ginsenosidivorans]